MVKRHRRLSAGAAAIAGAVGFAWFFLRFGASALDVQNVGWVMSGDWGASEIGWLFFRRAPWTFPVGTIPSLLYPVGSSVALTDATPIVSLLLKPFSGHLPAAFQFIGPWLALCFTLQGITGALLTSAFTEDRRLQALGGALFALSPVLEYRVNHPSLCAHWLVLVALWMALRPWEAGHSARGWLAVALGWVALAAGVHPYLWAMVTVLELALLWRLHLEGRAAAPTLLLAAAVMVGVSALEFWSLGLIGHSVEGQAPGFGAYNPDLLTLVNPMGLSRLVPAFPTGASQYEGFGYLGLGVLVLLGGMTLWAWPRRAEFWAEERTRWLPVATAVLLLTLFAMASVVTVAGHRVLSARTLLRPLAPLTGAFRASGRFIWPLDESLVVIALALVARRWPKAGYAAWVLLATVAVQALDAQRSPVDTRPRDEWNRFRSPRWDALAQDRSHLMLYPAQLRVGGGATCEDEDAHAPTLYLSADWLAYRHGMTVNSGYVARVNAREIMAYCRSLIAQVQAGRFDPDALYLVADGWARDFEGRPGVSCERIDGQLACVASAPVAAPVADALAAPAAGAGR